MSSTTQLNIGVIYGGPSNEAKVSESSANGLINALSKNYRNVYKIELSNQLAKELASLNIDVAFPISHGSPGEDGTLQGFLDILQIPYVGSGVLSSALAMHKISAKRAFSAHGLPVAKDYVVNSKNDLLQSHEQILSLLGDNVVIKPMAQGSALGVTFANKNNLLDLLKQQLAIHDELLVEEKIEGKEITNGILQTNDGLVAFPVTEIITPKDNWYDYEHRYTAGLSDHIIPAELNTECYKQIQDIAKAAFSILKCRDLARADFLVSNNQPILLEVNTLPGMTPTSLYPEAAEKYGLDFASLTQLLIERAWLRKA